MKASKPKAAKAKVAEGLADKPISTGGRPSWMNVAEYREDMCEQVIAYGSEGLSECQISARINVPRTTMRSWAEKHPDFSSALTRAKELEQNWWEDRGQKSLENKDFNANLWKTSVASRFRGEYGDKVAVGGDQDSPIRHVVERIIIDPKPA